MKVRRELTFFYAADIYRGNRRITRQGTVNAFNADAAIERVYNLGRTVWKRSVVEVTIMDPADEMSIVGTSKMGDKISMKLLPYIEDDQEEIEKKGFVPWNKSVDTWFNAGTFGTYFAPKKFNKLQGM